MAQVYDENIVRLIRLSLMGALSEEEQNVLDAWVAESEAHRDFYEEIRASGHFAREYPEFVNTDMERGWQRFRERTRHGKKSIRMQVFKYAAAVVVMLSAGISLWMMNPDKMTGVQQANEVICAGEKKALLLLPDGTKLTLGDMEEHEVEVDEGRKARQTDKGLAYDRVDGGQERELKYNTLQIPRGGEFQLTLSDGTLVILNSATDLKFPIQFDEKERRVFLSGEAYFEVVTDSTRPFIVETGDVSVRVYGTSFNMNTCKGDDVQTVLVSGKVGVRQVKSGEERCLEPGELACYNRQKRTIDVRKVNTSQYVAWTKGIFSFEDEALENIMRTLSSWYDVDVFFQSEAAKQLHFSGYLGRYKDIREILDMITDVTGVVFSVKGRTITVSK